MTKKMTEGNPVKLIVLFALPLLFGNVFQMLYSVVDTIIVGRTIGVNALAAVGSTASIIFLIVGFTWGASGGLSIITSQRFGAGDDEGVKRSVATSILISLLITIVLTAVSVPLMRNLLFLMQTPAEIIDDAYRYIVVIMAGVGITMFFNLFSNLIRALGDSKTPLLFLAIANVVNIALSLLFIIGLGMGVAGCAYATIIAQLISVVLCMWHIKRKLPLLLIQKRHLRFHKDDFMQHLRMGIPMGIQSSVIAIGALIIQVVLNRLGPMAVAAFAASQRIDQIGMLPLVSFGMATGTFVAQNYGAHQYQRIREGVRKMAIISSITAIIAGGLIFLFGRYIAALFVGNEAVEVLNMAQQYLQINGAFYWVLSLLFVFRFSIQGLGNSTVPLITGGIELICRSFAGFVLAAHFGFVGAVWSNPLAWFGAGIPLCITYLITLKKLSKNRQYDTNNFSK